MGPRAWNPVSNGLCKLAKAAVSFYNNTNCALFTVCYHNVREENRAEADSLAWRVKLKSWRQWEGL